MEEQVWVSREEFFSTQSDLEYRSGWAGKAISCSVRPMPHFWMDGGKPQFPYLIRSVPGDHWG